MISIITIVKNDPGIKDTLARLTEIPKPEKTEIIVVDASDGKLDYIRDQFPDVRWIPYTIKKKKPTIPEQRNTGIKAAKGEVIVFIDANCVPVKNWLIELYNCYKEGENIVCGPVKPVSSKTINNISYFANDKQKYTNECPTINVLISKKVFEKNGYFDETFYYGSDVDFMWRAQENKFKIRVAHNALVSHDWGDEREELKRAIKYGSARIYLLNKHRDHIKTDFPKLRIYLIYMMYIIGLPIALIFPYYLLVIPLLILNNLKYPHPVKLVLYRFSFAWGMFKGIIQQIFKPV